MAIASLVFDFLCIHPFRDGNGRVSRLLTVLALASCRSYDLGKRLSNESGLVHVTPSDELAMAPEPENASCNPTATNVPLPKATLE